MEWTISPPHNAALSGTTGNEASYTVHMLTVKKDDPLLEGFVEFWRRILSEGPDFWTGCPEKLWFQFWTDDGIFTAVFTSEDYYHEQPGIYKLISGLICAEYDAIDEDSGEDSFDVTHDTMMIKYWTLFTQAASIAPIPALLKEVRSRCPFKIMGTYCELLEEPLEISI